MRTFVHGVRTFVLICLLAISNSTFSQSITSGNGKFEVGLSLGPLLFLGDLGGHRGEGRGFVKDLNIPLTKFSKGLYAGVYPAEWFGFRLGIMHGKLEGYDNIIRDKNGAERFRKERNLQFQSTIMEANLVAEVYPTIFMEQYDGLKGKLRPYGVAGIGAFKFNPKGQYFDATGAAMWVPLQPLRLEGQGMSEYPERKEYSLMSIEIPMGVGAKYYIKENMYIGLEILHRKTFTDYIDDVSTTYINNTYFQNYLTGEELRMANQLYYRENFTLSGSTTRPELDEQRGDPKQNDAFFSSTLRFGWRLNDWNSPNGRAARQLRCPAFY